MTFWYIWTEMTISNMLAVLIRWWPKVTNVLFLFVSYRDHSVPLCSINFNPSLLQYYFQYWAINPHL